MLSLRRPSTGAIREFLTSQSKLGFTYSALGATATVPPAGYAVDHTRIKLGEGEVVFTKAKLALGHWDQFRLGWVEAWSPETPIHTGEVVAVVARLVGLWWLNACRIVYVVDETGSVAGTGSPSGRFPITLERARRGSLLNGIERAARSGTTSWRSLRNPADIHQVVDHVDRNRVHANPDKRLSPFSILPNIHHQVEQTQQHGTVTNHHQHEGRGPELLDHRKLEVPQPTQQRVSDAPGNQVEHFAAVIQIALEQSAGKNPQQAVCDRRQRAEQSFRVIVAAPFAQRQVVFIHPDRQVVID